MSHQVYSLLALWGDIEAAKKPTSPWYNNGLSPQMYSLLALCGEIEAAKKPTSPLYNYGFSPTPKVKLVSSSSPLTS